MKGKLVKIVNKKAIKTALQTYTLTTDNYVSDRLTIETKALNDDVLNKWNIWLFSQWKITIIPLLYIAQRKQYDITRLQGFESKNYGTPGI